MIHPKGIQDVIEMYQPFKGVITSCLDGKIRMFDIEQHRQIGLFSGFHETGVKQLDFTPYHGAALLSVGHEVYFNLWEIESSLSFGKTGNEVPVKLNSISAPVVGARFLSESFFIASVDTLGTVKIWNSKTHNCIQVI